MKFSPIVISVSTGAKYEYSFFVTKLKIFLILLISLDIYAVLVTTRKVFIMFKVLKKKRLRSICIILIGLEQFIVRLRFE
jgi:hypothetical protein